MEGRDDGGKTAKLLLIGKISNVGRLLIGGNRDGETIPVGTRYTVVQDSHSPASASLIRYRGSRVYFGARYYRGVDFIVNIYEGGSLGWSRSLALFPFPTAAAAAVVVFVVTTTTTTTSIVITNRDLTTIDYHVRRHYPRRPFSRRSRIFPFVRKENETREDF